MLTIRYHSSFRKDYKRIQKRGYDLSLLKTVVEKLASGKALPRKYLDHPLKGAYAGCRECHIAPDWLLVYEIRQQELVLLLTRTGTHSDLFKE